MRIFIDANVLISVLNKELTNFDECARILSLADSRKFELYTSPLCLAISFYFAEKKSGHVQAKNKIALITERFTICNHHKNDVLKALENKQIHDFEDGLEYFAALSSKCRVLITNDTSDFYFSTIEVLHPGDFIRKYV